MQIPHDAVGMHPETIATLECRLQPILRGAPPSVAQGPELKRIEPSTKLGSELRGDSDHIKQATNQLNDILSRLEI